MGERASERERGGILSFRWNSSRTDVPLSESNRFYRDTKDWNIVKSRSIECSLLTSRVERSF